MRRSISCAVALVITFEGGSLFAAEQLSTLQQLDAQSPLAVIGRVAHEFEEGSDIKLSAMKDAALAIGAQHGFAHRMDQLKQQVYAKADYLDSLYDFGSLMRLTNDSAAEAYLLPPVIQQAENVIAADIDQRRIRISNEYYVITEPARLVTRPPNWREFLVYDTPVSLQMPDKVLLPENGREKQYWANWVEQGWTAGVGQAEMEMMSRVRKLAGTYTGMTRYARMNLERRVEAPTVANMSQQVTGNTEEMRIGDQVLELVTDAKMNTNADDWLAIPGDSRDSLLTEDEADQINKNAAIRHEVIGEDSDEYLTIFGNN